MKSPLQDPKTRFSELYRDISSGIETASHDILDLDVEHEDGRKAIDHIVEQLRGMQHKFDDELALLEGHVEWDKFTIAFFGETNAGKSTIIESLRILFEEESRSKLLRDNGYEVAKYKQALEGHIQYVRDEMLVAHESNLREFGQVRQAIDQIKDVIARNGASRQRKVAWIAGIAGLALGALPSLALILHR